MKFKQSAEVYLNYIWLLRRAANMAEKTVIQTLRASFPPQTLAVHCR